MTRGRLEAFSDGVIAIIITITILIIDAPAGNEWLDLMHIMPLIICYLISFFLVGMNWANHHHLLQATKKVNGKILWANLLYLFCLSFIPVSTGWVGKSKFEMVPVKVYVIVNLGIAFSYILLEKAISHGQEDDRIRNAVKSSRKELWTVSVELIAFILSFFSGLHYASCPLIIVAYLPWVVPDLRMKKAHEESEAGEKQAQIYEEEP